MVHNTLGVLPGSMDFNRDMILDIPIIAELMLLRQKRQQLIEYNLRRENNQQQNFDY